jgi:hypothetical protein
MDQDPPHHLHSGLGFRESLGASGQAQPLLEGISPRSRRALRLHSTACERS